MKQSLSHAPTLISLAGACLALFGVLWGPSNQPIIEWAYPLGQNERANAAASNQNFDPPGAPFLLQVLHDSPPSEAPLIHKLRITSGDTDYSVDLRVGERIQFDNDSATVAAVRPWSGLLRHASGSPMASISFRPRDGSWSEHIFLTSDSWVRIGDDWAVCLYWLENENEIEEQLSKGLPGLESARWGVTDGERIHWFKSFIPGTGVELNGGAVATLVEYEERVDESGSERRPAIHVQIRGAQRNEDHRVSAEESQENPVVRFDWPTQRPNVLQIFAWKEDAAYVQAFRNGTMVGRDSLALGDAWELERFPYALRVEELIATAVSVPDDASDFLEAVLDLPSRQVRVRQGEAVRLGDAMLRFVRTLDPAATRLVFQLQWENGDVEEVSLDQGQRYAQRKNGIDYTIRRGESGSDRAEVLITQHRVSSRVPLAVGLLLLLAGTLRAMLTR